jgi:hypothetical protein
MRVGEILYVFLRETPCPLWLSFLPFIAVDHSREPIAKVNDLKIYQQSNASAAQSHVRQQLRSMNGIDGIDTFNLDNDGIANDQIYAIAEFNPFALVNNRQSHLTIDL